MRLLCGSIYAAVAHPSFIKWPSCRPPPLQIGRQKRNIDVSRLIITFFKYVTAQLKMHICTRCCAQKMILGGMEWYAYLLTLLKKIHAHIPSDSVLNASIKKVHYFCNIWSVNSKSLIWPQEDKRFQLFNRKFCFWKTVEKTTVG